MAVIEFVDRDIEAKKIDKQKKDKLKQTEKSADTSKEVKS